MKGPILISLLISSIMSPAQALDRKNCTSKLFDTFLSTQKTGHSKVLAKAKGDLLSLTHQYEITCPWQIEADFDGDKQIDWVGIAQKETHYELVAYLSNNNRYQYQIIKQYDQFPSDVFLTLSTFKSIFTLSQGKLESIFPAQYVLVENQLAHRSNAFGLKNNKLDNLISFDSQFSLKTEKQPTEELIEEDK